jgi:hypothetical protein
MAAETQPAVAICAGRTIRDRRVGALHNTPPEFRSLDTMAK